VALKNNKFVQNRKKCKPYGVEIHEVNSSMYFRTFRVK